MTETTDQARTSTTLEHDDGSGCASTEDPDDLSVHDVNDPEAAGQRSRGTRPAGITSRERGPYRSRSARILAGVVPPSEVLAQNIAAYRALRHITQAELAGRMTLLGHAMGRSTVSAMEVKGRNVTVDELFGLAVSIGVTIGQLLDPTGPDHSRPLALDIGLRSGVDDRRPLTPWLSRLCAASRVVVRLSADDVGGVVLEAADELAAAVQRDLRAQDDSPPDESDRITDATFRHY